MLLSEKRSENSEELSSVKNTIIKILETKVRPAVARDGGDIKFKKFEDIYLLRDSMKGLFLAASKYPKNRETRAPKVSEINTLREEIIQACRFLPDKEKHLYLLDAPETDKDGNPYVIRYNRTEDTHYVASEKDGKKTKWTATYSNGQWVENLKS